MQHKRCECVQRDGPCTVLSRAIYTFAFAQLFSSFEQFSLRRDVLRDRNAFRVARLIFREVAAFVINMNLDITVNCLCFHVLLKDVCKDFASLPAYLCDMRQS